MYKMGFLSAVDPDLSKIPPPALLNLYFIRPNEIRHSSRQGIETIRDVIFSTCSDKQL